MSVPELLAGPPFPHLARLAAAGRLPPGLLLSGPPGAPTEAAAVALAAILNSPDATPGSAATRAVEARIRRADELSRAGNAAKEERERPGLEPYPDVRILRPETGKTLQVREIRGAVAASRSRPFEGRRRLVILVGADSMTPSASNALLKTLEEPHEWLGLILCTTREAALLPTIVSRCQRWRFRAPTGPEVAAELRSAHGYAAGEAALAAAASGGDLARALALPRSGLAPLAETCEQVAAVVTRGIPPAGRRTLTEKLTRAPRPRRGEGRLDELPVFLRLLRAKLRDLAALAAGAEPLDPETAGGASRESLRKLANRAPGRAFAEAFLLVEAADDRIHRRHGNRKMQLDGLLLAFNEIARPLVLARLRKRRGA